MKTETKIEALIEAAPDMFRALAAVSGAASYYATLVQVENFDRNDIAVHAAYERLRVSIEAARAALKKAGAP